MKTEEWTRITEIFNSSMGTCRRTPQQLRLKWENLKKNSRKRSTLIRMERIKTGGGPPEYFPPDDILDKVAALLGSTGEGLTERFGGDAEPHIIGDGEGSVRTAYILPDNISPIQSIGSPLPLKSSSTSTENTSVCMGSEDELTLGNINTRIDPEEKKNFRTSGNVKRKLLEPDNGARNSAIAEYYNAKKKLIESKNENIKLQNENIKLQNENIKLQNEKLTLEIRKLTGDDAD